MVRDSLVFVRRGLLLAMPLLLSARAARPAATITPGAAFSVAVTAAESVIVDCSGGFVRVQIDLVPTVSATACSDVTTLAVTGSGNFNNVFNLTAVTPALFPALTLSTLIGSGGTDALFGSAGDDLLNGGTGDDTLFGGAGSDLFVWNPGDGSDILEGQGGSDTLEFTGANVGEVVDIDRNGGRMRLFRNVGTVVMDVHDVEVLDVALLGGSDIVTIHDLTGVSGLSEVHVDGGDGTTNILDASGQLGSAVAITLTGGAGADTITGSPNADVLEGRGGTDTIVGGGGNDRIVWRSGDGDDSVDGGAGADALAVEGSASNEALAVGALPTGFSVTADAPAATVTTTGVEQLDLTALGGADSVATVPLAATAQSLAGGDGIDTLAVTAGAAACTASAPGTLTLPGAQPITYTEFENLALPPGCLPVVAVPTLGRVALALLAFAMLCTGLMLLRRG